MLFIEISHQFVSSDIGSDADDNESNGSIEETAQEKRLRLAKEYIARLEEEGIMI